MTRTAIDTELPLGKILDDYLFSSTTMNKIKDNSNKTAGIAETLKTQAPALSSAVSGCSCHMTNPDPPCNSCGSCSPIKCTCDPCLLVRSSIETNEVSNLKKLDELKKQVTAANDGTIELLKDVKTQLGKLQRIERFMKECPMWRVGSLAEFFYDKDFYSAQKWTLRNVQFWENIIIGEDWVTLYCPVSGTILGETPEIPNASTTLELPPVEPPSSEEQMACTTKIPVGEIIDRAERIANRLIANLESLINLDRQLEQAIDQARFDQ